MKNFREAAEKQLSAIAREFFNSDDMTIHDLTNEAFDLGYSEAKKEVREFYLKVRRMMHLEFDLVRSLSDDERSELINIKDELWESLASFTEQEQKENETR